MRQRAASLGGQSQVRRLAGGGTEVEVRLPLNRVLEESSDAAFGTSA